MSYDLELIDPVTGATLEADVPHNLTGGTYSPGNRRLELNVTYNYSSILYEAFRPSREGIRALYGLTGKASALGDSPETLGLAPGCIPLFSLPLVLFLPYTFSMSDCHFTHQILQDG